MQEVWESTNRKKIYINETKKILFNTYFFLGFVIFFHVIFSFLSKTVMIYLPGNCVSDLLKLLQSQKTIWFVHFMCMYLCELVRGWDKQKWYRRITAFYWHLTIYQFVWKKILRFILFFLISHCRHSIILLFCFLLTCFSVKM